MGWLTANEALARLGTKPQTLYANVSRGRIRAKPDPADSRRSLYDADDVDRLAGHHAGRRKAEAVAADAMRWGDPILPSGIATVAGGRLLYRGRDAAELAETATLEDIAALLWTQGAVELISTGPPIDESVPAWKRGLVAMAACAASDAPSYGRSPAILRAEARLVVSRLADAMAGPSKIVQPLHKRLATAWRRPHAADAIRRTLVLMADHELNASTFAARVAVSTGAALSAGVLAGLATLSGPLHGGAAQGAQALAQSAEAVGAEAAVRQWLGQGRRIPAFGHRLYPEGDIRAAALLPHIDLAPAYADLIPVVERVVGEKANVDFALAALTVAFDLPVDAPLIIFALSRCVGWLAHGLEQAETGHLIRPRAHYVGAAMPTEV
ncbi:MAG TPA: citrate synthase [Devosiaceae bacterium]|jgi:citrate synthase